MTDLSTIGLGLTEGINQPSPIRRVIAWDWHDGLVEGLLQVGDSGPTFKFSLLEESSDATENELKVYGLYAMPSESFSQVTELLSAYSRPNWPVWWAVWKFPSDEIRNSVEGRLNEITDLAGSLSWIIVGDLTNNSIRAMPVSAVPAA